MLAQHESFHIPWEMPFFLVFFFSFGIYAGVHQNESMSVKLQTFKLFFCSLEREV